MQHVIDFHQTVEVNGIKFWCCKADVLGTAMFMVDIIAGLPQFSPDICIIESTSGVQLHQSRHTREKRFTDVIHSTVSQGGRALIPAFALGRAHELLLILDEYWDNHPDIHNIPIYYASPLAKKCMAFVFKHISALNSIGDFGDVGPSVVMASPGGLQSGFSRQLFDIWCSDKRNACIIPVHYISFSAHADYAQMSTFLKELMPLDIVLVHGEANELMRLTQKLFTEFPDGNTRIMNPKNCESVEKYFTLEKMEKTIGRLAEKTLDVGDSVSGILVKKGFTYQIMAPDDLHVFSQLSTGTVTQRITIPFSGAFGRGNLTDEETRLPALTVHERVTVKHESGKHISLQWSSDPISDMVSDPIVALVLNISREVPKIVNGNKVEKVIYALFVSLFGDVKLGENGKLVISVDDNVAHLDKESGDVESEHDGLNERVRVAFHRIQSAVKPIPLSAD
ncbi:hypothetical protein Bca52824_048066 [Brassica carinata]|uniref:Beta-Casp domain-containing protein n=1 Tax=Brassica carinata TaxID=52824 RepID=A0A8X7RIF2_BRACI|nr:hypothetical protein Bca52824_048066 [Brassica carinata]